ncbi:MAG: DNA recombination protein RmuC [Acidaminococcaceae bacterium]|nr:DNA recombination protein RmuC [Acidaminococcaceae bacterium]
MELIENLNADLLNTGLIVLGFLIVICLLLFRHDKSDFYEALDNFRDGLDKDLGAEFGELQNDILVKQGELKKDVQGALATFNSVINDNINTFGNWQNEQSKQLTENLMRNFEVMLHNIDKMENSNRVNMESLRKVVGEELEKVRKESEEKLEKIRHTVDEQLQSTLEKRINQSFKTVNEQLQQVYQGLGEMKNLATDVGGLKKILGNVKTRGILGEVQLGAILSEILASEQYEENVETIPNTGNRVEYAVHLPGEGGNMVLLPIDAKFPNDRYEHLLDAKETGNKDLIETAYKELEAVVKSEAKDIRDKYVEVPYTTNFGIMFLASEGLYAEVISRGMLQKIQSEYHITIAGPSTMAAYLNSLQMGFRTLAIQQRSSEVWELLGAVKTEFEKFADGLTKMKTNIKRTDEELDKLMGTRTKAINRKLREVQTIDLCNAEKKLGLADITEDEE